MVPPWRVVRERCWSDFRETTDTQESRGFLVESIHAYQRSSPLCASTVPAACCTEKKKLRKQFPTSTAEMSTSILLSSVVFTARTFLRLCRRHTDDDRPRQRQHAVVRGCVRPRGPTRTFRRIRPFQTGHRKVRKSFDYPSDRCRASRLVNAIHCDSRPRFRVPSLGLRVLRTWPVVRAENLPSSYNTRGNKFDIDAQTLNLYCYERTGRSKDVGNTEIAFRDIWKNCLVCCRRLLRK